MQSANSKSNPFGSARKYETTILSITTHLQTHRSKLSGYSSRMSEDSSHSDRSSVSGGVGGSTNTTNRRSSQRKSLHASKADKHHTTSVHHQFALYDDEGNDVTPRPMFNRPPAMPRPLEAKDSATRGSRTVLNASTNALSIKRTLQV